MKDDADVLYFESGRQLRAQRIDVVDIHVEEFTRLGAHGVMVFVDVRVESHCSAVAVHELDLAHFGKFIQGLVDGAK